MIRLVVLLTFLIILSLFCAPNLVAQTASPADDYIISTPEKIAQSTRFVVYYTGNTQKDLENPNSYLNTFIDVYELRVVNTFEFGEDAQGFTLQPKELLESPNETAKELSLIDGVMMIEVVYCKPDTES
ncbi:MAG: hypothetical protein AB8E82_14600 [Aureispira sp.]